MLLQLPIMALSSLLITRNEKTKEKKNVTKSKESKELREGSSLKQLVFSSAITRLTRAERWDDIPSMSSEVGEI